MYIFYYIYKVGMLVHISGQMCLEVAEYCMSKYTFYLISTLIWT